MTEEAYKRRQTASQLAALTLANAFIFQEELASEDARVERLRRLLEKDDPVAALADHWEFICDEINYVPIFHLAREILLDAPPREEMYRALRTLGEKVLEIVSKRAALRHDLMGRIYHRLLLEAKYLGTYYTAVPSANLLLKLSLRPEAWAVDWSDASEISKLRIADLACGTGTLLMAAQQAVTDNFVRATTAAGAEVSREDLKKLHAALMEDVLHGYDVLSSAVHLTASTLALLAPEISFDRTNLVCLPLGVTAGGTVSLGSVEFLHETGGSPPQLRLMEDDDAEDEMVDVPVAVRGEGGAPSGEGLPELDLCVMNPPFTRSVGGNLLFGSLPEEQRSKLQSKLKKVLRPKDGRPVLASSTAGLGSVFVAVADVYMKPGSRMGLVLPLALAFGAAWEKTRKLFEEDYTVEFVISSHDPERWNFSENTDLSEVLVVARHREEGEAKRPGSTTFVSLWRNPTTPIDALGVADLIQSSEAANLYGEYGGPEHGITSLVIDGEKRGEMVKLPWGALHGSQWYPAAFAQTELMRAAHFLREGKIYIPGTGITGQLELTQLSNLGELGPDRRDVYDGFNRVGARTSYPGFWGHDSSKVKNLAMDTNTYLEPLEEAKKGRPLRDVEVLWPRSGRIMIAERMRLNTQRLAAVRLPEYALSNVWWPFRLDEESPAAEKALVMWLNSTLGLINTLAHKVPTEGPWVDFKKPSLRTMPVLDVTALSDGELRRFSEAYDKISDKDLRPVAEFREDEARELIDEAFADILGIGPISKLQEALGAEPTVCGNRLERPVAAGEQQVEFAF